MFDRSQALTTMIRIARRAGAGLMDDFGARERLDVREKSPSDYVSSADLRSETLLRQELSRAYPDSGLLFEEGTASAASGARPRFIVDPLDGTTNFLHGIAHFAVSIALELEGSVIAGVVFDVAKNELFHAEVGHGAYLGEQRLSVSKPGALAESLIATGVPHHGGSHHAPYLQALGAVMQEVAGIRRWGSAALDLCYVAAGRYDAFFELGLAAWDVAAGNLIVREAGGRVTRTDGSEAALDARDVFASCGEPLHGRVSELLAPLHGVAAGAHR